MSQTCWDTWYKISQEIPELLNFSQWWIHCVQICTLWTFGGSLTLPFTSSIGKSRSFVGCEEGTGFARFWITQKSLELKSRFCKAFVVSFIKEKKINVFTLHTSSSKWHRPSGIDLQIRNFFCDYDSFSNFLAIFGGLFWKRWIKWWVAQLQRFKSQLFHWITAWLAVAKFLPAW